MARIHLTGVKEGDFLEPDASTGDLGRAGLTESKQYQVLRVIREGRDVFVKVEDDAGSPQTYSSLWFKYPIQS